MTRDGTLRPCLSTQAAIKITKGQVEAQTACPDLDRGTVGISRELVLQYESKRDFLEDNRDCSRVT